MAHYSNSRHTAKDYDPQFVDSKGNLKAYAYACGYCDRWVWESIDRTLSMYMEHGAYHIKGYRPYNIGDQDCPLGDSIAVFNGKHISESFPTLGAARKRFNEIRKEPDILIN
jgi:hypothetical protein